MKKKTNQEKMALLKEAKRKEREYHLLRIVRKNFIKSEPSKSKRFWKLVWFYLSFPFSWLWRNLKDWRTFVIFVVVMLVVGCEVWIPLLLGIIFRDTTFGKTMLGVASACEIFWLAPATPFLPLCIVITIGVKSLFDKIRFRRLDNGK